jgi:putative addiction module CopG family antidote
LTLAPEIQKYIESQMASGAYRSQEEFIAEAIRALRARDERAERRAALVADLADGIQSLDNGQGRETTAKEILSKTIGG